MMGLVGVELKFLLAYSPELNLAELVFSFVKNYLHHHCNNEQSLEENIQFAFNRVTPTLMYKFYKKNVVENLNKSD